MSKQLVFLVSLFVAVVGCQGNVGADSGTQDAIQDSEGSAFSAEEAPTDVVFVCQHGYAKSLVASRYFERLAEQRGLLVRGIARGTTPSESVPESLSTSLRSDGFDVSGFKPQAIEQSELAGADYVVAFGNDLPESSGAIRMDWGEVSALSENYPKARDEIVAHLEALLDQIEERARSR